MKKLVQRTKGFEKSFWKLNVKTQRLFVKKLYIFIDDEYAPSLKTHKLKGKLKNEYAFSVTGDVRAVYEKTVIKKEEVFIFKFVDIGGHSKVY